MTAAHPADGAATCWERTHDAPGLLVAYFSPEFGLDASLPVYSGGLGVLAGDHLKSAGDLGLPLVGVGLFYRRGYFRQSLVRGRQHEAYPELDPAMLGLTLELGPDGRPLVVDVDLAGETVLVRIWRRDVRGTSAYFLDSDVEENSPEARSVTDVLYGGDREHRIRQELILGVGGARALAALGLEPTVYHLNEGHAAFLSLERIRALVAGDRLSFRDALDRVRSSTVFTTHTPVPAGNERFDPDLAGRYLEGLAAASGVEVDDLLSLGHVAGDPSFGLTPLALRTSAFANGVSKLHGAVSRRMWSGIWEDAEPDDVPISHVTNAVHAPTWVSDELQTLLRTAGVELEAPPEEQRWELADALDPVSVWDAHARCKARLFEAVAGAAPGSRVGGSGLDPEALTIGFARRFAAYKRAGLLLSDAQRFFELVADEQRPIQLVYAGKAHPADGEGKSVLAEVTRIARSRAARGRVAFLTGYDIELARLLVQGVDVWLNTPRLPLEASGTSGMKAAMNGVLNLSTLDGWWPEAYSPEIGWAIPEEVSARGDEHEAAVLLRMLREEVAPAYYDRDGTGLPSRWVAMMRASIVTVGARFGGARMVAEYGDRLYLPAHTATTSEAALLKRS